MKNAYDCTPSCWAILPEETGLAMMVVKSRGEIVIAGLGRGFLCRSQSLVAGEQRLDDSSVGPRYRVNTKRVIKERESLAITQPLSGHE